MLDVEMWDRLLKQYVDDAGRVDYRTWKEQDMESLQEWIGRSPIQLKTITMIGTVEDKLAFWINLYNALAIAQVLDRYPIPSVRPKILGIPNWIRFLRFFMKPIYETNGASISLNHIEHKILREQFQEPRIHFALVCAAIGCPLLRQEAYRPVAVYTQLEEDASRFIRNPSKVRYEPEHNRLYCSKIFKWYRADFKAVAPSVQAYISRYLDEPKKLGTDTQICYLPYDLRLNQQ